MGLLFMCGLINDCGHLGHSCYSHIIFFLFFILMNPFQLFNDTDSYTYTFTHPLAVQYLFVHHCLL